MSVSIDTAVAAPKKAERNVALEICRISAMVLIFFHHSITKGGVFAGVSAKPLVTLINFLSQGWLGVILFILLTGYFTMDMKFSVKGALKVLAPVWVYSYLAIILFSICKFPSSPDLFQRSFMPVIMQTYWFPVSYIVFYIFGPMLGAGIRNVKMGWHLAIIAFLTICFYVLPYTHLQINEITPNISQQNQFMFWIYLFLIASFIKKFPNKFFDNFWMCLGALVVVFSYMYIFLWNNWPDTWHMFDRTSWQMILLCVLILLTFKNMKVRKSLGRFVLPLATTMWGFYLIHDNVLLRDKIWGDWNLMRIFHGRGDLQIILYSFAEMLMLFVIGTAIEYGRLRLFRLIGNVFQKRFRGGKLEKAN